jgi:hypothetical protein
VDVLRGKFEQHHFTRVSRRCNSRLYEFGLNPAQLNKTARACKDEEARALNRGQEIR